MIFENTYVPTDWGLYSGIFGIVLILSLFYFAKFKSKIPTLAIGLLSVGSIFYWWAFELDEPHEIRVYQASENEEGIKVEQHFVTAGSEYQYPDGRKIKLAMAQGPAEGSVYSDTKSVVINETSEDLWMTNVNAGVSRGEEAVLRDLTSIKPGEVEEFSHVIDTRPSARRAPPKGAFHNPDRKDGDDFYWLNWVNRYYQVDVFRYLDAEISREKEMFKEGDEYILSNGDTFTIPLQGSWGPIRIINDTEKTLTVYDVTYYQYYWAINENPPRLKDSFLPWSKVSIDYAITIIASREIGPPEEIKRSGYTMQATLTWLTWDDD